MKTRVALVASILLVPGWMWAETSPKSSLPVVAPRSPAALRQLIPLRLSKPHRTSPVSPQPRRRHPHRPRRPSGQRQLGARLSVGWGSGESMTFTVRLAGVDGGRAAISVGKTRRRKGRETLVLRGLGETVPFISTFSRMREDLVTRIDLAGLFPLSTRSDRQKGNSQRLLETNYGTITRQSIRRGESPPASRDRRIARPVYDPISALFLLRSIPLQPGSEVGLSVLSSTALYRVELKVAGPERVYGRLGARDTIRINGVARRILDNGRPRPDKEPRRFSIWLSADDARIPIRLAGETDLGLVDARITSHHPPRRPASVRWAVNLIVARRSFGARP